MDFSISGKRALAVVLLPIIAVIFFAHLHTTKQNREMRCNEIRVGQAAGTATSPLDDQSAWYARNC